MKQIFSILLFTICIHTSVIAQRAQVNDCGTLPPTPEYFQGLKNLRTFRNENVLATYPLLMKVFVTVVANDNGTSVAAPDSSIFRQLENMRRFYALHNICFLFAGKQQVNNTDLNMHDVSTEIGDITPFVVENMLNIFIHTGLVEGTQTLNGFSYGIPGMIVSIVSTAILDGSNITTLTHELGHNFGLVHTHETAGGTETVARSGDCMNCWEAGDGLCDTEADPNLDNFPVNSSCVYTGTASDECGWMYTPNPRNIMAYGNRSCRNFFTEGQAWSARFWIENTPFLIQCIAPDDINMVFSFTQSSGRAWVLSRNTITINAASYQIIGSSQTDFISARTILKPGVRLSPGNNGYIRLHQNILCQ